MRISSLNEVMTNDMHIQTPSALVFAELLPQVCLRHHIGYGANQQAGNLAGPSDMRLLQMHPMPLGRGS